MKQLIFKQFEVKHFPGRNSAYMMSPVELKDYIDYEVKRIYFLTLPVGQTGEHCHKIEKEFFILLAGRCTAIIDRGNGLEELTMLKYDAMYVGNYVWHGFKDFSIDTVLLALSSTNYNPDRSDYVEDYTEYKKLIQQI